MSVGLLFAHLSQQYNSKTYVREGEKDRTNRLQLSVTSTMADIPKKKRSQALSHFTRAYNELTTYIDESAPPVLTTRQFEKLESCWEKLEAAQDVFIEETDIDVDEDPLGIKYLDEPGARHASVLKRYAEYLKKAKVTETRDLEESAANQKLAEEDRLRTEAEQRKVADDLKKAEELNVKFESAKTGFLSRVSAFKELNADIQTTLTGASDADKGEEWKKK